MKTKNRSKAITVDSVAQKFGLPVRMTLAELMVYARCKERHIFDEIKRQNLKAYKIVRGLEFDPKDVEAWIKRKVKTA